MIKEGFYSTLKVREGNDFPWQKIQDAMVLRITADYVEVLVGCQHLTSSKEITTWKSRV